MSNPWDSQPIPTRGDVNADSTFAGVGRVLTQWENVEIHLSELYSYFVGKPQEMPAIALYGLPKIFSDRMNALEQAAHQHFIATPDQANEGEFCRIARAARGFSARRNEVGHGVVHDMRRMAYFRHSLDPQPVRPEYCLVPPHFARRNFNTQTNAPTFAYAAIELQDLEAALAAFGRDVAAFRNKLIPDALE